MNNIDPTNIGGQITTNTDAPATDDEASHSAGDDDDGADLAEYEANANDADSSHEEADIAASEAPSEEAEVLSDQEDQDTDEEADEGSCTNHAAAATEDSDNEDAAYGDVEQDDVEEDVESENESVASDDRETDEAPTSSGYHEIAENHEDVEGLTNDNVSEVYDSDGMDMDSIHDQTTEAPKAEHSVGTIDNSTKSCAGPSHMQLDESGDCSFIGAAKS